MSSSRAIKPKRDDTLLSNWESMPERAPSIERADRPLVARVLAMIGLFFLVLGGLAVMAPTWKLATAIGPGWGFFSGSIGLCLILFHAFSEHDFQFRRLYGVAGLALVLGGVILRLMAFKAGYMPWFILGGVPGLAIGLIVLVAVIRNETDVYFRTLMLNIIGAIGALMIAFCIVQGVRDAAPEFAFMPGEGALLLLLGLFFTGAFIGQQDLNSENGYRAGLGLGAVGIVGFAIGFLRSYFFEANFLVPSGLILMGMSLLYIAIALGICVDWPIIVLARRDLAAYFYSPIAYLVFVGILLMAWWVFDSFVGDIVEFGPRGNMFEPIVERYIFQLFPVIVQIILIPVITMRLMSEETRTGTLEVLMTAPVNEVSVVLGKFLACWIFYMLTWLPWWLFLVGLRYFGGEEFDYRPVLSFTVALAVINGGLLAMGLFFSSLTKNQIIAAVLTFVGVIAHLGLYILKFRPNIQEGGAVHTILTYVNFFDLWQNALGGIIAPRFLLFHLSVTVFFLFATIKVLESRKWK